MYTTKAHILSIYPINKCLLIFTLLFSMLHSTEIANDFEKVVIWGHKLHSHTHSYIHNGFYIAFNHLGYQTFWFDDEDDISEFDFSNTLFLTEGQVDNNIPIRKDCKYILHNVSGLKYQAIPKENRLTLQVYTDDVLLLTDVVKVAPFIYYNQASKCLYMPWASDLLPHEIEKIKEKIPVPGKEAIYWIGTVGDGVFGNINQINPFVEACTENGIIFISKQNIDPEDSVQFIQNSYIAPTITGEWQSKQGYIPCRIFKNISYGKMGITNSKRVYELFEEKIVYNPDTYQLFYDAQKRMETFTLNDLHDQMDFVKTKHTYLNRIQTILYLFNQAL